MKIRFPPLHDFQREFVEQTALEQLFSGGAGIGKTEAGVFKLLKYAFQYPKSQTLYAASTWQSMLSIFLPVLEQKLLQLPPGLWQWQKQLRRFVFSNGSILHYRNLENPAGIRSMNLDFALLEEATEIDDIERVTGEVKRGLRNGRAPTGLAYITNPGLKTHYLYKHFFEQPAPSKWAVSLPAKADHLTPEYLALLDSLPPSLRESFYLGEWGVRIGQAFPDVRIEALPDDGFTWSITFDYGFSPSPMVYLLVGVGNGVVYVRDELTLYRRPTPHHLPLLQRWYADYPIRSFTGETATGAGEVRALLQDELKLLYVLTNKDRALGAQKLADLAATGRLVIHPDCADTPRSLRSLDWVDARGETDVAGDDDHHYDALRYYVSSELADESVGSSQLTIARVKRQTGEFFGGKL